MDLAEQIIKYVVVFLSGLTVGSFINCLVWRQNNNLKVTIGRSQCQHCCRTLAWWENIPLFSYFFLKKKCRVCKKIIPAYYPLVEFFTGVLFLHAYVMIIRHFSSDWIFLVRELVMLSVLVIIFTSDVIYRIIWPSVVWFGLIAVFIINIILKESVSTMFFGFLIGGGFFLFQYTVSKGRWIGGGDIRVGAMMGVWLGWPLIIIALLLSYFIGALSGISMIAVGKKKWASAIAFGPYLVMATFLTHYFGLPLLQFLQKFI